MFGFRGPLLSNRSEDALIPIKLDRWLPMAQEVAASANDYHRNMSNITSGLVDAVILYLAND
jgi:hypothetical protein